ncbi:MAG: tRNA lysidine(34) synthetase TilS [Pseudomonadota bacterium]
MAIAVSGGGDSIALLHRAARWADDRGRDLIILTVDHGLRAEAVDETAFVETTAQSLGLKALTLKWQMPRPGQGHARRARHSLLADAARQAGAGLLLLGHTEDDQAETVLMRSKAGAGARGLAGIAPVSVSPVWPEGRGLLLARPLLGISRGTLRNELRAAGHTWIDDPTNENADHARVRARQSLASNPQARSALLSLQARYARLRRAEDRVIAHWSERHLVCSADATLEAEIASLPKPLRSAAMDLLIQVAAGHAQPVDRPGLAALCEVIDAGPFAGRTLAGAYIRGRNTGLFLGRDPGAVAASPIDDVFDGRFARSPSAKRMEPRSKHASIALPPGAESGGWRALAHDRLALWRASITAL